MTAAFAMPVGELDWVVVNDTVMGGVSRSTVEVDDSVRFTGTLSLEQNGGFVSVRAKTPDGAFEAASDIELELRGDGRTYDLTLRRSDVPLRAGSYRVRVPTEPGKTTVTVPLSAFRPTSFGRPVPGAPALDAALDKVDTVGLLLADKQPGPFEIEVLSMSIVRDAPDDTPDRKPAIDRLSAAIEAGVPLFNAGDHQACAETYREALEAARESGRLTPGETSLIEEALATAKEQPSREAAWTLRHAMDSVLYTGSGA